MCFVAIRRLIHIGAISDQFVARLISTRSARRIHPPTATGCLELPFRNTMPISSSSRYGSPLESPPVVLLILHLKQALLYHRLAHDVPMDYRIPERSIISTGMFAYVSTLFNMVGFSNRPFVLPRMADEVPPALLCCLRWKSQRASLCPQTKALSTVSAQYVKSKRCQKCF